MAQQRHLRNAPIVEAVIDIRVPTCTLPSIQAVEELQRELSDQGYAEREEQVLMVGEFGFGVDAPVARLREKATNGYRFPSNDGSNIVQCRRDGFTFSRLRPYTTWEMIYEEARKLWPIYVRWIAPELIERLAVRYINHVVLPEPVVDLGEYLTSFPPIPPELPQRVTTFLSRVVVHDTKNDIKLNLIQATPDESEQNRVIIDIDAYKTIRYKLDDDRIWSTFGELRAMKNQAFFGSITETTARLYE